VVGWRGGRLRDRKGLRLRRLGGVENRKRSLRSFTLKSRCGEFGLLLAAF
jgi:hypothetical protein